MKDCAMHCSNMKKKHLQEMIAFLSTLCKTLLFPSHGSMSLISKATNNDDDDNKKNNNNNNSNNINNKTEATKTVSRLHRLNST